jgi:hypothetical protein
VKETLFRVSLTGVASVVLTVVLWLSARKYMPPQFDGAETAFLFFVCFLICYFIQSMWRRFAHKHVQSAGSAEDNEAPNSPEKEN